MSGAPGLRGENVRVLSCPNRRRQVEVLKEAILHLLDTDSALAPNQVAILCPDPEAYRPWIEALFPGRTAVDGAEDPQASDHLDWHFLDTAALPGPWEQAFDALLDCPGSRLGRSVVAELVAMPACAEAFGLSPDDVAMLHGWMVECGVRGFLDAGHRAAEGLPEVADNTWAETVERLCRSMLYEPGALELPRRSPALSRSQCVVLGRFLNLLGALAALCRGPQWTGQKSVEAWADQVRQAFLGQRGGEHDDAARERVISRYLVADDDDRGPERLSSAISEMVKRSMDLDQARGREEGLSISFALWRAMIREHLDSSRQNRGHALLHGVCIARFQPFRLIPFRHVFVLGMDEGSFPARDEERQLWCFAPGAKAVKDQRSQDLYSLLEALATTVEGITFLYQGHDPVSRKRRLPSAALADLVQAMQLPTEQVPLHCFDAQEAPPTIHGQTWRRAISGEASTVPEHAAESEPASPVLAMAIEEAMAACTRPLPYYGKRCLEISDWDDEDEMVDDALQFAPESLRLRRLRRDLLDTVLHLASTGRDAVPEPLAALRQRGQELFGQVEHEGQCVTGWYLEASLGALENELGQAALRVPALAQVLGSPLGSSPTGTGRLRIPPFAGVQLHGSGGKSLRLHGESGAWFVAGQPGGDVPPQLQLVLPMDEDEGSVIKATVAALAMFRHLEMLHPDWFAPGVREQWTFQPVYLKLGSDWKLAMGKTVPLSGVLENFEARVVDALHRAVASPLPFSVLMLKDDDLVKACSTEPDAPEALDALAEWFLSNSQAEPHAWSFDKPGNQEHFRLLYNNPLLPCGHRAHESPGLGTIVRDMAEIVSTLKPKKEKKSGAAESEGD